MPMPVKKVTGPVTTNDLDLSDIAELAREIATSLGGWQPVIKEWGLTVDQYRVIAAHPFFVDMLRETLKIYDAPGNAAKRIEQKGHAIIEHALPTLGSRIADPREPLEKVAQMVKVIGDITGLSKREQQYAPQERISISIDLGADTKLTFDKGPAVQPLIEGQAAEPAVRQIGESAIALDQVLAQPKGKSTMVPLQALDCGDGVRPTLQALSEGEGVRPTLQPLPKGN